MNAGQHRLKEPTVKDIFGVRGAHRERRGDYLPTQVKENTVRPSP
jgi:hypothetical protein